MTSMSGAELRQRRESKGLSVADLASMLGKSSRTIERWEAREALPIATCLALYAVLVSSAREEVPMGPEASNPA